jgi:hypothetical protein
MFCEHINTSYTIKGIRVTRILPSGYYAIRINGNPLMADTIRGLRQLVKKKINPQPNH